MQTKSNRGVTTMPSGVPEARYAYYRRCRQFHRNGEQCKAPAMKGESICYKHAEQAATESRRVRQRRELLSRPGAGFGDFKAIQRTISEVVEALLAGRIDAKTAGRLIIELQTASKLLWQQHLSDQRGHEGTQRKQESRREESRREEPRKEELRKEERRLPVVTADPCVCRERRCSAVAGQMRRRTVCTKAWKKQKASFAADLRGQTRIKSRSIHRLVPRFP